MSFREKELIFKDFLFVAFLSNDSSLKVNVRRLGKANEDDKDLTWLQYESIFLPLNLSKTKLGTGSILLFENVEDTLSGIVRPTILFHFCGDIHQRQCVAYILVLMKEKSASNIKNIQWKIKPIKKFKTLLGTDPKNLIFLDQCSFLHSSNEQLYFCNEKGEHSMSVSKDCRVQNVICMASKTWHGTSFVLGVCTVIDDKNISDDQEMKYKLFSLKKHRDKWFEILDPALFLSEDYASCISKIYIHWVAEIPQNIVNIHGQLEKHPSKYKSSIFLILNHGYLLEFVDGQLKMSLSLVNIYCELKVLEYCQDGNSFNFEQNSSLIRGAIELDEDRKILILQQDKVCIAVDTKAEKVLKYWEDIQCVLIEDVMNKGRDQLVLIHHLPNIDEPFHWYITDFNTVYLDCLQDEPDSMMYEDDENNTVTARNALQQQLTRMSLSVEQTERRLKEKLEFIQCNLSRLQTTTNQPSSLHKDCSVNPGSKREKYEIEIKERWHHVIDDCLVIGLHVINQSSRSISDLSLSILCKDIFNDFKSTSKQHRTGNTTANIGSASSKRLEHQTLKKIKLSLPDYQDSNDVLLPKDEIVLTGHFELSQLSDTIKGQLTLFLFLHFSPCGKQDFWEESQEFCVQNGGKIEMNFNDFFDNSFTEMILRIPTFDENLGQSVHHGLLCLNTIQQCYQLILQTKYGYINLIADWLRKIPGLVFYEHLNCYMLTLSGALYLTRMEIHLQSDFKNVQTKIYARNKKQFQLFLTLISTSLPNNVSYQLTSNQNQEILIQNFLNCVSMEIQTGLFNLPQQPAKTVEIIHVDFQKQENVFKFHAGFEKERKELVTAEQTLKLVENCNFIQRKVHCEKNTDSVVEKM